MRPWHLSRPDLDPRPVILARVLACLGAVWIWAGPGVAEPVTGVWQTEPDRKALISHIRLAPCGDAVCGTVVRVYDQSGQSVQTPNLGRRLFWDLYPSETGVGLTGKVFLPLVDIVARVKMVRDGAALRVTACKGPICKSQRWRRIK